MSAQVKKLKEEMRDVATKAQALVDEGIDSSEKREKLDAMEEQVKQLAEQIADEEHLDSQRELFSKAADVDLGSDGQADRKGEVKSIGQQFVESDGYQAMLEAGGIKSFGGTLPEVEIKDLTEAASAIIQPDFRPDVVDILAQRPTVADLMPSGSTNSNVVRYLKETTRTNAAAATAESGTKPESDIVLDEVDEPVRKIATLLDVTDEMLEDWAQARSYIDNRLLVFVQEEEDDQLLNGSGTAPELTGLLNRAGLQTAIDNATSGNTDVDDIYHQITAIRQNAFVEPTGVVVHPEDWRDIRLAKDGNQNYYGPGPFADDDDLQVWGVQVVVTSRIAAGTALVGAFRTAAQVFRKGGLTVDATNSHGTNFGSNITTLRAEERLALAVYRPGAFGTVTGL